VAYERYVKPQAASLEKMALSHIVTLLADETANPQRAYACDVLAYEPVKMTAPNVQLIYGRITLKSRITLEEKQIPFAVFRRGSAQLVCAAGTDNPDVVFAQLKQYFEAQKYEECARVIRQQFITQVPLESMFMDVRRKVVEQELKRLNEDSARVYDELFQKQYPVVRSLQLLGTPVPATFLHLADFVLTQDLVDEFRAAQIDVSEVEELMEDVKTLGLDVSHGNVAQAVSEKLTFLSFAFARNPLDKMAAHKLVEFLNYTEIFGFSPNTIKAQEFVYFGLRALGEEAKKKDILRALARKLKIALS
jgi:hypothetical protein